MSCHETTQLNMTGRIWTSLQAPIYVRRTQKSLSRPKSSNEERGAAVSRQQSAVSDASLMQLGAIRWQRAILNVDGRAFGGEAILESVPRRFQSEADARTDARGRWAAKAGAAATCWAESVASLQDRLGRRATALRFENPGVRRWVWGYHELGSCE